MDPRRASTSLGSARLGSPSERKKVHHAPGLTLPYPTLHPPRTRGTNCCHRLPRSLEGSLSLSFFRPGVRVFRSFFIRLYYYYYYTVPRWVLAFRVVSCRACHVMSMS
ncbi:hypothetical protein JB92DRAFT_2978924 [Gautieria morchelliformis]|nr:hypothetical protein JB92DRAFT_2978924 [Gautieria morchelliformis]